MRFKINSILEYTAWVIKKYNELQCQQDANIYRIIDIKTHQENQFKFVIQIIGKSAIIESTPEELVTNDKLLEGFSRKDIRTIVYYACEQIKQPTYKIVTQEFSNQSNDVIFKLKNIRNKKLLVKTASQILLDKSLMQNLSLDDTNSISYIAGYESSQRIRD